MLLRTCARRCAAASRRHRPVARQGAPGPLWPAPTRFSKNSVAPRDERKPRDSYRCRAPVLAASTAKKAVLTPRCASSAHLLEHQRPPETAAAPRRAHEELTHVPAGRRLDGFDPAHHFVAVPGDEPESAVRVRASRSGTSATRRGPRRDPRGRPGTPPHRRRGRRSRRRRGGRARSGSPAAIPDARGGRRGHARAGGTRSSARTRGARTARHADVSLSWVHTPRLPCPAGLTAATISAALSSQTPSRSRLSPFPRCAGWTTCSATIPAGGSSIQHSP